MAKWESFVNFGLNGCEIEVKFDLRIDFRSSQDQD